MSGEGGASRVPRRRPGMAVPTTVLAVVAAQLLPALASRAGAGWARAGLAAAAGASHAVLYCGLGALFGLSLLPGREALVSRMARGVEPRFGPALARYTRGVTWLWFGFALAQLLLSGTLLLLAPLRLWWDFVATLDLPLVLLVFLGEYAVRRLRFRGVPLATLRDTVRAFGHRGRGALAAALPPMTPAPPASAGRAPGAGDAARPAAPGRPG